MTGWTRFTKPRFESRPWCARSPEPATNLTGSVAPFCTVKPRLGFSNSRCRATHETPLQPQMCNGTKANAVCGLRVFSPPAFALPSKVGEKSPCKGGGRHKSLINTINKRKQTAWLGLKVERQFLQYYTLLKSKVMCYPKCNPKQAGRQ